MRQRQPLPDALLQRLLVNEVAQRDVLGNQAHGVDQDALIAVLTPAEQRVASLLTELAGSFGPDEWSTPAGTAVGELLGRLGHDTRR